MKKKRVLRTDWKTVRGLLTNKQYEKLKAIGRQYPAAHRAEVLDAIRCAYLHRRVDVALAEMRVYYHRSLKIWKSRWETGRRPQDPGRLIAYRNGEPVEQTTGFLHRLKRQMANNQLRPNVIQLPDAA